MNEYKTHGISNQYNLHSSYKELKKLKKETRNKVRAILSSDEIKSTHLLNRLRKQIHPLEIIQVEKSIAEAIGENTFIPEHFPTTPQTSENYKRICSIEIEKSITLIDKLVSDNFGKIKNFFEDIKELNKLIVRKEFEYADILIGKIFKEYGYSHFILRKSVLLINLKGNEYTNNSNMILRKSGVDKNRIIISSLLHCFQEDYDHLSMKRSIMSIANKGDSNRFTRDIIRTPFHPHAVNNSDLEELLQSSLQSSLIDAIIIIKINYRLLKELRLENTIQALGLISESSPNINEISGLYLDSEDPEDAFYKHSCAWYESDQVLTYRMLQDFFYDSEDSDYINLNNDIVKIINLYVEEKSLNKLADSQKITAHDFHNLQKIEQQGTVTRSSIFNFLVYKSKGDEYVSEENIINIMHNTSSLSKSINIDNIKKLALHCDSDLSKVILYLLVAKKSKSDLDNYELRRLLQSIILRKYNGKIIEFISDISKKSTVVSRFIYDVCTEDFIAKLFHIVKSSAEITETRAALHRWMGDLTKDKAYYDKARNIEIEDQINLVRNEIDDNRIYVDTTRFGEWIDIEVLQELNTLFTVLGHNRIISESDNPQFLSIIERCYKEFCSNKHFGIASYLGRRIRHGTFKGHLYSGVVRIENGYSNLLEKNPQLSKKWSQWKADYEEKIDSVILNKLHIESTSKKEGLLIPNLKNQLKLEMANACVKELIKGFNENGLALDYVNILIEYCWRIAEIDLKSINTNINNSKSSYTNSKPFNELKNCLINEDVQLSKDFIRELQSKINEKITTICGWFKRPQRVSPKISLNLLYKAVISEVKQTFPEFNPEDDGSDDGFELLGGSHHIFYDAFYVVIYNAAKHGKKNGSLIKKFEINYSDSNPFIKISIESEISDEDDEEELSKKLVVSSDDGIENAQLYEDRSGIKKLYNLQIVDRKFIINEISCSNRMVRICFIYNLVH